MILKRPMRMSHSSCMSDSTSRASRRGDTLPVLMAFCWVLLQKGCILTPDISPAQTSADSPASVALLAPASTPGERLAGHPSPHRTTRSGDASPPALEPASDLTAIRLILQAIAILKPELMRESPLSQYDRMSI